MRIRRIVAVAALATLGSGLLAQPRPVPGKNYAFLVAVSGYDRNELKRLPYTVKEMDEFRQSLERTGFERRNIKFLADTQTEQRYVSQRSNIVTEFKLMLERVEKEDTLVVALNGHGVHFKGDKTGYFCPLDASLSDKKTLIPMEGEAGFFDLLRSCKAKKKLLIVNACRNDPASDLAQAARRLDLDDEDADTVPEGIAAIYSCKPGQRSYYYPADDPKSPAKERSLFFHHLIEAWNGKYTQGKTSLEDVFREVKSRTADDADEILRRPQVPVVRREYTGEWTIGASGAGSSASNTSPPPMVVPGTPGRTVTIDLGNAEKLELIRVEPTEFTMGSAMRENEKPARSVRITKPYWIGKYEVKRGQFARFVTETSYVTEAEKGPVGMGFDADKSGLDSTSGGYHWRRTGFNQSDDHPATNITWNDAKAFCNWLQSHPQVVKQGFRIARLPSEAEWECACKAGSDAPWSTGPQADDVPKAANLADGSLKAACKSCTWAKDYFDNYAFTAPVGSFAPNKFGIYDMHGNVWEWCEDYFGPYSAAGLGSTDPLQLLKNGNDSRRVIRGGSILSFADDCRATCRESWEQNKANYSFMGFRVVLRQE